MENMSNDDDDADVSPRFRIGSPSGSDFDADDFGRRKSSHMKGRRRRGGGNDVTERDVDVVMASKHEVGGESTGKCVIAEVANHPLELFVVALLHAGW